MVRVRRLRIGAAGRRLRIGVAAMLALAALGIGTVAWAEMTDGTSASHELATATLEPPTLPAAATGTCVPAVSDQIVLTWSRTTSGKADGYEILRAAGTGPYSSHALVAGQATESFTDSGLAFSTDYHYVVKAKKASWRSAGTSAVSRTTRTDACL